MLARQHILFVIAGILSLAMPAAWALQATDARAVQIRPQLAPLPDALNTLDIRLHLTTPPTLGVHNPTDRSLVIRDASGHAFLSIGPDQVTADINSPWFQRARLLPADNARIAGNQPPEWRVIADGDRFAWQDLRLRIHPSMNPPAGVTRGRPKFMQRFRIPVTLGQASSHIGGVFLYHPSPSGVFRAVITDHGSFGKSISVQPLVGKSPGLLLRNRGEQPLTVVGVQGEPFLRFEPGRVLVNPASSTWQRVAPAGTDTPYQADADAHWVAISSSSAFGWHDPRMRANDATAASGEPEPVHAWNIPVVVGEQRYTIQGVTWWLPPFTAGLR